MTCRSHVLPVTRDLHCHRAVTVAEEAGPRCPSAAHKGGGHHQARGCQCQRMLGSMITRDFLKFHSEASGCSHNSSRLTLCLPMWVQRPGQHCRRHSVRALASFQSPRSRFFFMFCCVLAFLP